MKKGTIVAVIISTMLLVFCVCVFADKSLKEPIVIYDDDIPMNSLVEGIDDIKVIPDKYNTGCTNTELIKVEGVGTYGGVQYTAYGAEGNGSLRLEFYKTNRTLGNDIYIRNCDFSSNSLIITYTEKLSKEITVHFENCKFSKFTTSSSVNLTLDFKKCEFAHFGGSKATFDSCFFGGCAGGDGINPGSNCTLKNCYIADLVKPAATMSTNHVDGFQIFSATKNVVMDNCRFEVPYIPYTATAGSMNCPVTFTLRSGNAEDITFNDCYVNGGQWFGVQLVASSGYTFSNILFNNVKVGGASKAICNDESGLNVGRSLSATDSLYVASVWRSNGKIHLSVSNDTNQVRTLKIITDKGDKTVTIRECPRGIDIVKDSMIFSDFPFDIDVTIDEASWVVCYDITGGLNKRIRFVNWSGQDVEDTISALMTKEPEINKTEIAYESEKELEDSIVQENEVVVEKNFSKETEMFSETELGDIISLGKCGANVNYYFDGETLLLSGEGSTFNYNSSKTAPWYTYRTSIMNVIIEEGITKLGTSLFLNCSSLETLVIPNGVVSIEANAFNKCKKLSEVKIPETVTAIGKFAFAGTSIKTVNFAGTQETWNSISFGENCSINSKSITMEFAPTAKLLYSGECGKNAKWLIYDNGVLSIEGSGETFAYSSVSVAPWSEYKSTVSSVIINSGITKINNQLFTNMTCLKEIYIADSVTSIGNNAFSKNKSLTTVYLGAGIKAIDKYAFNGDTALSEVTFGGTKDEWNSITFGVNDGIRTKVNNFMK